MTRVEVIICAIILAGLLLANLVVSFASWLRGKYNAKNVVSKLIDRQPSEQAFETINKIRVFPFFEEIAIYSDLSGNILYVNDAITKTLGWLTEDIIGKNALILIPTQFHKSYQKGMKNLHEVAESHFLDKTLAICLLNEDGKEVPVEVVIKMKVEDGHPYLVGIIRDMSAYNAKIKSMQWMIDFYQDSLGLIDAGCFNADIINNNIFMDVNMREIFDLPKEEGTVPIGVTTDRIYSPDRDIVAEAVRNAIETKAGYEIQFRLVNDRLIKLVAAVVLNEFSQPAYLRGALRILRKERA